MEIPAISPTPSLVDLSVFRVVFLFENSSFGELPVYEGSRSLGLD